jgi:hypothetical protein
MHYDKNRLIILTESSCFITSPNPRVINTDIDTAYLGTGDFLGIPASQLSSVNYGFGGCQNRLGTVNTEYGFFWCDRAAGRVFQFTSSGSVEELSSEKYGNHTFFTEKLPQIQDQLIDTDSTISGSGIQMSYDPEQKRVILHCAEFKQLKSTITDLANPEEYENLSFTVSFYPEEQIWASFHSWQPELMFSDRNVLYSTVDNMVYSHTKFETEFYNTKYPFIIEYVDNNATTNDLEVISYYAQTLAKNQYDKSYPTFNKLWCYSNDQSTGNLILLPKTDYPMFWNNTSKTVVHAEQNYRISGMRDLLDGTQVWTTDWNEIQSEYNGKQGFIDKLPVNINTTLDQRKQIPLRNKYHIIRLSYNNSDRLIFNLTETVTRKSIL